MISARHSISAPASPATVSFSGCSSRFPAATWTSTPSVQSSALRALKTSAPPSTIVPKRSATSSGHCSSAWASGSTVTPDPLASSPSTLAFATS